MKSLRSESSRAYRSSAVESISSQPATGDRLKSRLKVTWGSSTAMALLLALALTYWTWFGLTQRSINTDDGFSIQSAQSILVHGYQLFPSGYLYPRGYTAHYILAGTFLVLGVNDFTIMLPSLLMALGSLWLLYLLGRDVMKKPWLGVAAGAMLLTLDIQGFYATGPRMYMALQFFTMLAVYSAWRGYVGGETRFRLVMVLSIAAAILAHREGGIVMLAVPMSALVAFWFSSRKLLPRLSLLDISGAIFLVLLAFVLYVSGFPGAKEMPAIADFAGASPGRTGPILDPVSWGNHLFQLERAVPYGLTLMLLALFPAVNLIRKGRQPDTGSGLIYLVSMFALSALGLALATTRYGERLWLFVLPIYALLLCFGVAILVDSIGLIRKRWMSEYNVGRLMAIALLAVGALISVGMVTVAEETTPSELALQGYGLPCNRLDCSRSIGEHYQTLRQEVGSEDLVISTNPAVSRYYLGQTDGWLRERVTEEGEFTTFLSPTDEYYGIPLIDAENELVDLLQADGRVWIIADQKVDWAVSPEAMSFIEANFERFYTHGPITTYVNCMEPSCPKVGGNR